ncbi:MAG: HD-GYP domain-containing protein [Ruminococcus sp.]|nr:HD-GYP domain-containing protein [Ruminococcus sp.]
MPIEKIEYEQWRKVITRAQIGMAICVFFAEAVVNTLLYITRSQGYNPDTIVNKLIRYQLITTLCNILPVSLSWILCKFTQSNQVRKYILTIAMSLICLNTSFSHYQFAPTFLTFIIPIMFTIMYEDKIMCRNITIISILMLIPPIIARGTDKSYNADIGPEAIISITILILISFFSKKIITVLVSRRTVLNEALLQAEKVKYIDELNTKNKELELLANETFEAIAKAVDVNDPYTAGHSRRVARYSRKIAECMGYSDEELEEIYCAGLIHDVGKLGIDNRIINKPGKLSEEEYSEIKKHPLMGYEILKKISIRGNFAYGAKWHHERMDGKGYPDGLLGDNIPKISKIIAVADAYDAMTSKRAYRDIMPQEKVREQIAKGAGTQFDAEIAAIMLDLIDKDTEYTMKQSQKAECTLH